jgi:hypothetical protein
VVAMGSQMVERKTVNEVLVTCAVRLQEDILSSAKVCAPSYPRKLARKSPKRRGCDCQGCIGFEASLEGAI